jgi:hypothetical protein
LEEESIDVREVGLDIEPVVGDDVVVEVGVDIRIGSETDSGVSLDGEV